jgi:branched-chain amino acid transport system permease protein
MFFEQLLNGLGQGSIYALMAIGYALIFGVIGLVTFAHGDVIMIGAFAAYYSFAFLSSNVLLAVLMGFAVSGLLGFILHRVCYNRFFNSPRQISLICTIGAGMFLRNLVQVVAGTESKPIPRAFSGGVLEFAGLRISHMQIFIFAVVLAIVSLLTLFLNKTRTGLSLKAVSMDKTASALLGINTRRTTTLGNMIGCAIAGAAGVLLAMYYGTVTPMMGGAVGMKSFCCAVLGGMASIGGAAVGGLLIGIAENVGIMFLSAGFRDTISFLFLILILLVKPEGLFVKKGR